MPVECRRRANLQDMQRSKHVQDHSRRVDRVVLTFGPRGLSPDSASCDPTFQKTANSYDSKFEKGEEVMSSMHLYTS
jgi:hypothetical protein